MTRRARLLGAALAVALAAGCGTSSDGGTSTADPSREWAVGADPDATPAEVVAVGGPADVVVSADGRQRLVTWEAEGGSGDGPQQGAWRLSGADGTLVAEGGFGPVSEQGAIIGVVAVADGFVLESYTRPALLHVDPEGTTTTVKQLPTPRPTRAGDVLVRVLGGRPDLAYRPSDRTAAPLPPLPTRNPQGTALGPDGAVWVLLPGRTPEGVVVARSGDGRSPWRRAPVPLPRDGFVVTDTLTTTGDDVVLLSAREVAGDEGRVDGLWSRGPGGSWRRTDLDVGDLREVSGPRVERVDDRLLLTTWSDGAWVQATDGDGWDEVPRPSSDATVVVRGDRLWALDRRVNRLATSDDLGATWQEVAR